MDNTIKAKLNMKEVFPDDNTADKIFNDALRRWGGSVNDCDANIRKAVMLAMKEQVEARFQYDYKASFDMLTGSIVFTVGKDSDWDDSNENSNLFSLEIRSKGKNGGLIPDKHGDTLDAIVHDCEKLCRDYAWVALSYSAAGVVGKGDYYDSEH